MIQYKQHLDIPLEYIREKISAFLLEDMPKGDVTTSSIISKSQKIIANIQAEEELIFAGEKIIPYCFEDGCSIELYKSDGDLVNPEESIGEIQGPASIILSNERVMLNLIQRLCGIASTAFEYVQLAHNTNVKILDTRKTSPGLRLFEKYAVAVGGAYNHRLNLSDGILIKDNHIVSTGSVNAAIQSVKKTYPNLPLEIEVDTLKQIKEALIIGVDGFLLDNMNTETVKEAVEIIRNSKNGNKIFIEASGGIVKNNIKKYLDTGINAISIGAITHSVKNKDIRLEFIS